MTSRHSIAALSIAAVILTVLLGVFVARTGPGAGVGPARLASPSAAPRAEAAPLPDGGVPNFEAIVVRHGPAVVNVAVVGDADGNGAPWRPPGPNPFGITPFGRGLPFGGAPPTEEGPVPPRGQGSGFIVSSDGLILTNAHVVENAGEVTVKLVDRREYRAKVLGADPLTDIAVMRIEASDLPAVTLGKVEDLGVGEWVLAIGSPFGFEHSATAGVVSAKKRSLPGTAYVPFIQTDVAVNPGNSGGPLFNAQGAVVGVNSVIYSRTGGYQGLSFAIPIDVAMRVSQQIVAGGDVRHGRLGVGIQEVTQALADSFGLDRPAGAVITAVEPGGPAARAGLNPGDIVRSVDGRGIDTAADLPAIVGMREPGERVVLEVWRQGRVLRLDATLGAVGETAMATGVPGGGEPGVR